MRSRLPRYVQGPRTCDDLALMQMQSLLGVVSSHLAFSVNRATQRYDHNSKRLSYSSHPLPQYITNPLVRKIRSCFKSHSHIAHQCVLRLHTSQAVASDLLRNFVSMHMTQGPRPRTRFPPAPPATAANLNANGLLLIARLVVAVLCSSLGDCRDPALQRTILVNASCSLRPTHLPAETNPPSPPHPLRSPRPRTPSRVVPSPLVDRFTALPLPRPSQHTSRGCGMKLCHTQATPQVQGVGEIERQLARCQDRLSL